MRIQTNKKMARLLVKNAISGAGWEAADMKRLAPILEAQVVEREGCFFLDVLFQERYLDMKEALQDDTGMECFVNHFHVEEYWHPPSGKSKNLGYYGLRLAFLLVEKLMGFTSKQGFKIIISADRGTGSVRFHKVRAGEEWVDPNLENYKAEAVMVVEI